MASINASVTDKELDCMMLAANKDGDGLITHEEFVALFSEDGATNDI